MDRGVQTRLLQGAIGGPLTLFQWIGWALLAGAFFLAVRADEKRREWIRVEGTIVEFTGGETDAPIVEYEAPDGETRRVTGGVSTNPRAGRIGDRVPVLINPADSEIVRLGTPLELWFEPGLLGGIGGVFVFVGTLSGVSTRMRRLPGRLSERQMQELRETGERVMARVTEVLRIGAASSSTAPGHWRLRAENLQPIAGASAIFVSQPILVDPSPYLKVGDQIGVFIDRGDPKRCAFDFSMMPFGG